MSTRNTPLHACHERLGARMIDFGGWDMPVMYSSIVEEHNATRGAAGLFDISHMGRLRFHGPDADRYLDHVLTNRVDGLQLGQARYALVLEESAGILDDVLVYRFPDFRMLVVNASNREKLLAWFGARLSGFDAAMTDMTFDWSMIAVQGPKAFALVQPLVEPTLADIRYYFAVESSVLDAYAIVSRTGYTGEDGVELIVPSDRAVDLWNQLHESGQSQGVRPAGLGARDTLRLEAGMPLYGHELDESIDPLQAKLGWAVKAKAKDFVGKAALASRDPSRPVRVGLQLVGKRIAREGFDVSRGGDVVGRITSGTFSPTLQASIAMGYVNPDCADQGTRLEVQVRNSAVPATVVALPFYKRETD